MIKMNKQEEEGGGRGGGLLCETGKKSQMYQVEG